jgi:hypothetical protein
MTASAAFAEFMAALTLTPQLWQSIEVRSLAVRHGDLWLNVMTRCVLRHEAPTAAPLNTELPISRTIVCRQGVRPFGDLAALVQSAVAGEIDVAGVAVRLEEHPPNGAPPQRYDNAYVRLAADPTATFSQRDTPAAHVLRLQGSSVHEVLRVAGTTLDMLDRELRALPAPWDGVESVVLHGIGSTERVQYGSITARFEIIAPLGARLDAARTELSDGRLLCHAVAATSAAREQLSVGVFAADVRGRVVSRSWDIASMLLDDGDDRAVRIEADLGEIATATVILRVGPYPVERRIVADARFIRTNPMLSAHGLFDASIEHFDPRNFEAKGPEARRFELAVGRLFTFAGFAMDMLSSERTSGDGPDAIAYSPHAGVTLVIECTTSTLATHKGKLGKLAGRAAQVAEAVRDSSVPEVHAIFATSLPRDQVAESERNLAATDGIAVLAREDLQALMVSIREGASARQVVSFLQTRVPMGADRSRIQGSEALGAIGRGRLRPRHR